MLYRKEVKRGFLVSASGSQCNGQIVRQFLFIYLLFEGLYLDIRKRLKGEGGLASSSAIQCNGQIVRLSFLLLFKGVYCATR